MPGNADVRAASDREAGPSWLRVKSRMRLAFPEFEWCLISDRKNRIAAGTNERDLSYSSSFFCNYALPAATPRWPQNLTQ